MPVPHRSRIQGQLRKAWETSGLTLEKLLELAGFEMTTVSLNRKLNGQQILTAAEAETLAHVLQIRISAGREARAS